MKVELEVHWKLGAEDTARFDAAIFALLAGIRETGSLQEASKGVGLSYRHAWGLLGEWAARLGRPLAELKRGRGSQLTPLGSALIAARERVESRYSPEFTRLASDLARQLSDPAPLAGRRWSIKRYFRVSMSMPHMLKPPAFLSTSSWSGASAWTE